MAEGSCTGAKGTQGESHRLSAVSPVSFWVLLALYETLVGVETAPVSLLLTSFQAKESLQQD